MAVSGVNSMPLRTLYPKAPGLSLATEGSSASPADDGSNNSAKTTRQPNEAQVAAAIGATGSPLMALAIMAIVLFALMFIAKRFGSEGSSFASIKLSIYNVLVISLAAIVGINFFKLVFTRFKVPGFSAMVLAA